MVDFEALLKKRLELDDRFEFKCRQCGECCRNRHDLLLTPYDVFRIAGYLQSSPAEVIADNCELYIGETSMIPVVKVRPVGKDGACPFLKNGKCSVHAAKPVVCAVYPLARIHSSEGESFFALQPVKCGEKKRFTTVREWIGQFDIPVNDEIGHIWSEAAVYLAEFMRARRHLSAETLNKYWNAIFNLIYLRYTAEENFAEQLKCNFADLKEILAFLSSNKSPKKQN